MASAASLLRMLVLLVAAIKTWAVQDGTYIHLACLPCQPACLVSLPASSACLPCQPACLFSLPALSACLPCQPATTALVLLKCILQTYTPRALYFS
jgi:hypothetical protein